MNELVSVITPSYNSEEFIAQAIESVLAQSYQLWEMIIVDDGSLDASADIINSYCWNDARIKLITVGEKSGPGKARNLAIKAAKGRYIAFLDSDDLWLPEKLAKQIIFMQEHKLAFTYASYQLTNQDNDDLGVFITAEQISYEDLLRTSNIGCLTAVYDTHRLGKLYMPEIMQQEDYGLWLAILKRIKNAIGMQEPLAVYRLRKGSISSNKLYAAMYQWIVYRDIEKLGLLPSIYYFLHYAYHGLMKRR